MELLHSGKVKEVYAVSPDVVRFRFSDRISVFDQIIPSDIPGKGESLARTARFWFEKCQAAGIRTHYLGSPSPSEHEGKRIHIVQSDQLTLESTSTMIPLECICRYYAAGSLVDRVRQGKLTVTDLGFPEGHQLEKGERLPGPYFEVTTKLEKVDRPLTELEALTIAKITPQEYAALRDITLHIDAIIEEEVTKRGLIHVDGKKEFAFDEGRDIMVIDSFGTGDEDRWWLADEYEKGELVEMSKEFIRQHYRETGHHAALYAAREKGEPDPPIPALPQGLIDRTSRLYADIFERITGLSWR